MKTLILAGMEYRCHSPSLFELLAAPGREGCWLACDGPACWIVAVRGVWAPRTFKTRHEASLLIREAFQNAYRNTV